MIADHDRRVGAALAAARTSAGSSRKDFAPVMKLTPGYLKRAENGTRRLQTTGLYTASAIPEISVAGLLSPILA